MNFFIKAAASVPVIILLSSCANNLQRKALSIQDRDTIKSDHVLVNTTQRELVMKHNNWFSSDLEDPYAVMDSGAIVKHPPLDNAGGGLIGVLVVSAIAQHQAGTAVKAMAPIRSALGNYDYVRNFNSELHQKISGLSWLKVRKQDINYNVKDTEEKIMASSKENTTLFVGTTYALNSVFKQIEVIAYVKLMEKQADGKPPKTLYANNFYYINRLPGPNGVADANKNIWMRNNAALLRAKLSDAASLLSGMIVFDMRKPTVDPYANDNKIVNFKSAEGFKKHGRVITQKNGYYIISLLAKNGIMNGYMYAISPSDLVS